MITLEDLKRVDLRVGEIRSAERIAGSRRLLRLEVELGPERRTIVAGVGETYEPEALRGLQVVVVANVPTATIRGVASQGMLLGVACDDARALSLLTVERPVASGAAVA